MRPNPTTAVYAAAKAGLNTLTQALAHELGPDIRVNAIVCGTFHTVSFDSSLSSPDAESAMASALALGRIAQADEIVGTALYLASPSAAPYLTGALIVLDGGGS